MFTFDHPTETTHGEKIARVSIRGCIPFELPGGITVPENDSEQVMLV
jgi:hypothetical protein